MRKGLNLQGKKNYLLKTFLILRIKIFFFLEKINVRINKLKKIEHKGKIEKR